MTNDLTQTIDTALDLVVEREIAAPPAVVWQAWTTPEHVQRFFVPPPVTITACTIDPRPGGEFRFVMRMPSGDETVGIGCYLEIVPSERLVWTDALLPGFRPSEHPFITMVVTLEPGGSGTRCRVLVKHRDAAERERHLGLGFEASTRVILDQLATLCEAMDRR